MYLSNFFDGTPHTIGNYLAIAALLIYIAFFSIGFSSTPRSVNTEIYPIHLIGTATALATATNWLSNFVVSSTFLSIMSTDVGKIIAFILLAAFALSALIFIYLLVPETNNRPIQENVDNILKGRVRNLDAVTRPKVLEEDG